jgi:Ca-activated chloride channel family protein
MNFGAPNWLWAFAILPLLVFLYVRAERRSAIKLREFVSPRLLPQLAGNVDRVRRAIRFAFVLLALALAITALAKPRWGYTYEDVKRRGLDLLFAVDTSRSMLSNDVAPNRLERVKLAAQDLITELQGDRAGLIAFAGRAFLQAPLTIDYGAAVESINDLDTKTIPEGGTNISEAIALATQTFGKSAMGNRALIIFTDGEELSGDAVNEARKAADAGVKIFTVGVGTAQGSLIPVEGKGEGGFVKDAKGQVVKSKLDENRLREIAQTTGGIYLHLESGPQTMRQLYADGLSKLKAAEIDARLSRRPIERYEWPLGGAIVALIASLFINDRKRRRRSVLVRPLEAVAALLLIAPGVFGASPGLDAYQQQKYEEALRQFQGVLTEHPQNRAVDKLQFDSGAAAYKLRDFEKALQAFSQALLSPDKQLQGKGHYNLGNTLYERGEAEKADEKKLSDWTNALKHYEESLKIDPQNKEAKDNYEFVKKKIEELKNKPQQQPSPTPPPQQKEKNQQQKDKDQQKQQAKNDQQQKNDQQDQQQQDQKQQQQKPDSSNNQQQQNKNQEQQSSEKERDQQQQQASPSPSPGSEKKQSDQEKKDQQGAGESPTPSPGESGDKPSPSPEDNSGNGESPSPSAAPSASPDKKHSGEIKSAGEPSDEQQKEQAAEAEAMERGEMSPQQATRLLQAMKDEEARVQLDERKPVHRVYNDW